MKLDRLRPFDAAQGEVVLRRLRGRKVCERVLRRGQVWKGKHMRMTYMRIDTRHQTLDTSSRVSGLESPVLYVGTIASTKLEKSAVKRNRMRRRCREALRITLLTTHYSLPTIQLLIAPRFSSLTCNFEELLQDTKNFLQHIDMKAK